MDSFCPQVGRNFTIVRHNTSLFEQATILPLSDAVLVRSVRLRELPSDASFFAKGCEYVGEVGVGHTNPCGSKRAGKCGGVHYCYQMQDGVECGCKRGVCGDGV